MNPVRTKHNAMILGTGVDIVEVARMKSAYERWGIQFAEKVLTPSERDSLLIRKDSAVYLASRFAAKEAFLKALGTGFSRGISWHDMEVVRKKGERPYLSISGAACDIMKKMGAEKVHLSISHEKKYAIAQVILEK